MGQHGSAGWGRRRLPVRAPEGAGGGPARPPQRWAGAPSPRRASRQHGRCGGGSGGWASTAPPAGGDAACLCERQRDRGVGQHDRPSVGPGRLRHDERRARTSAAWEGAGGGPARLRRLDGVASCRCERQRERGVGQHGYAGWRVSGEGGSQPRRASRLGNRPGVEPKPLSHDERRASTDAAVEGAGGGPARLRRLGAYVVAGRALQGAEGGASTAPAGEGAGRSRPRA